MYKKKLADEWIAWVEDTNPEGIRETQIFPFMKNWVRENKPTAIADIGCGQGACAPLFSPKIRYVGIDPSTTLIARAKKLHAGENREFLKGDAYSLPLAESSVDGVISLWVWSHLENLTRASEEMYRVLRSKGKFLIVTAHPQTYDVRKTFYSEYSVSGKLLKGNFALGKGKQLTDTTLYLHTEQEILAAINHSGLKVDSVSGFGAIEANKKYLYLVIEGSK